MHDSEILDIFNNKKNYEKNMSNSDLVNFMVNKLGELAYKNSENM